MGSSSTLVLPFPLYRLVFNSMFDPDRPNATFFEARAAGFGIFMGVLVFFWAPLAFWKWFVRVHEITRERR